MARTEILSWDWKGQPNLARLAAIIVDLSGGRVHLHEVDTGSDEYAIVIADEGLTKDRVKAAYDAQWDDE